MFNKNRLILLLSLLAATFALAACGSGAEEDAFVTVTSSAGFTIDLPESWASQDSTDEGFWFASSQEVLDAINADEATNGAGGNIQLEATETLGIDDPVELLELLLSFFTGDAAEGELTVVTPPAAIEGHPQSAAKAQLRGNLEDLEGDITAVVVIGEAQAAVGLIVDATAAGDYEAIIQQIADSIQLAE